MLVDTTHARRSALASALAEIGHALAPDVLARAADGAAASIAAGIAARALGLDALDEELTALRADRAFTDAMSGAIVLRPGAREALVALASRMRIVVVTRAPAPVAERIVALADLEPLVVGTIAADPERHVRALARLDRLGRIPANATVALEDGAVGIAAARAAGVRAIGVGPAARDAVPPAPWLASLAGVTYDALVDLLTHGSRDS